MLDKLKNWFSKRSGERSAPAAPELRKSGAHIAPRSKPQHARPKPQHAKVPRPNPEFVEADEGLSGKIESAGPGKNVLIRNKYVREDTGTHETLKILDDSIVDSGEEQGIDPYNTGGFDRSRNWDKRFGK
jgi:hypothetical protein